MNVKIEIDRAFGDVYAALDMAEQRKALRRAMGKEGARVRRVAVANLGSSGLGKGTYRPVDKGIYVRVYPPRYGTGFMVSTKPNGKKGIHVNRQLLKKPVLMWAEDGTAGRNVGRRKQSFFGKSRFTGKAIRHYVRGGHSTGRMRSYGFMAKTERETGASVEGNLFAQFSSNLDKAARRRGLL